MSAVCRNKATNLLIDGPRPDDYTLSCDTHEEIMRSDTHIETFPFDGAAECCFLEEPA